MKVLSMLVLLLGVFQVNAQEFVWKDSVDSRGIVIQSVTYDSVMGPFKAKGLPMFADPKDGSIFSRESHAFHRALLNDEIWDIVKDNKELFLVDCFFDREGKVIEIRFRVSKNIMERLGKKNLQYMYNQALKQRFDVKNLKVREDKEYFYVCFAFNSMLKRILGK